MKVISIFLFAMFAFMTYYFTSIDNWKFGITVMEANCFPLLVDVFCKVQLKKEEKQIV